MGAAYRDRIGLHLSRCARRAEGRWPNLGPAPPRQRTVPGGVRKEGLPRHLIAARRRRLDTVPPENALDRVAADLMAEATQRADEPRVSPRRVLGRQPDNEPLQIVARRR